MIAWMSVAPKAAPASQGRRLERFCTSTSSIRNFVIPGRTRPARRLINVRNIPSASPRRCDQTIVRASFQAVETLKLGILSPRRKAGTWDHRTAGFQIPDLACGRRHGCGDLQSGTRLPGVRGLRPLPHWPLPHWPLTHSGILERWNTGTLELESERPLPLWDLGFLGTLEHWNIGTLERWNAGNAGTLGLESGGLTNLQLSTSNV